MTNSKARDKISEIISSPAASPWLKANLQDALSRDITEAAYEAAQLLTMLNEYRKEIEAKHSADWHGLFKGF